MDYVNLLNLVLAIVLSTAYLRNGNLSRSIIDQYGEKKVVVAKVFAFLVFAIAVFGASITIYDKFFKSEVELVYRVENMDVSQLTRYQEWLNLARGISLRADGTWGPKTNVAIQNFQRTYGLTVTGRFNKETVTALRVIAHHTGAF